LLNLFLVDSELERVPRAIASHPAVRSSAHRRDKQPTSMLLDANLHHSAMNKLPQAQRRGRPDLVHYFLLTALESVLNKRGMLRVYVHTRNDELITIDPATRLPKNYPRFVGLMESLFEKGSVPSREDPLLKLHPGYKFKKCLEAIPYSRMVVLSEEGERVSLCPYLSGAQDDLLCVIGGFSMGDFNSDVRGEADSVISIYEESLTVWTVASELIVNYENAHLA
jgi:rRNA small subunit pseudouridine methyltransferase Nep1